MSKLLDTLWAVHHDPAAGHERTLGGLDIDFATGQATQVQLLQRWIDAGETVGGWKIGMTSGANRNGLGDGVRPFGFVLASRVIDSGDRLPLSRLHKGQVENELCLELGAALGAGATPASARAATRALRPAFEVNQKRLPGDVSAGVRVADDLSNWGIVVGAPTPVPDELDAMQVTLSDITGTIETVASEGHIDDHFESLAILANALGEYGLQLEPGHLVITGAYGKTPFAPGTYRGHFDCGVGDVEISLV
ncbi:MAG: hypothetical protein AAF513_05450 [Pseudomonadota bacterium]